MTMPQVERTSDANRTRRLALVLWSGRVGGAETLNVALAERLRRLGADITVVFIEKPWPLAERLSNVSIPYRTLALRRGRAILRHPHQYAAEVTSVGPDGALLLECGYIGAALRIGGYGGPIVAVEHGAVLIGSHALSKPGRLLRGVNRASGAWSDDAEVAVSDFMLDRMLRHPHSRQIQRIYNGVDPHVYLPAVSAAAPPDRDELIVGYVGRLTPGKGADHLLRAVIHANTQTPIKLLVAGDGSELSRLESLAHELGADSSVEFLGMVDDIPGFWQRCDVAAIPSDTFESFSMVTLEAMACSKPTIATHVGALPELVVDSVTGTLVPPGDAVSLARALITYAEQPELRRAHGAAARARAIERFHIDDCARAYLDLFDKLAAGQSA
jgi:glycosyltransferase involved in cell wall biosynthesis